MQVIKKAIRMFYFPKFLWGCMIFFAFFGGELQAQEALQGIEGLSYGRLPNGFRYFIKDVEEPQEKISMRFYVKAGYDAEDTTQLQISHLLEHVAFKPTPHTPNSIKDEAFLTALGMSIRDIGGTTSNGSTRYSFNAPSTPQKALLTGLDWFKDIAMNLPISPQHIDQEKGAVLQEIISGIQDYRSYFKAERNLEAQMFPCRQSYDHFSKHIQTISPEAVRQFYKEWYRPDLMALIVVGNFEDRRALERMIREMFRDIPSRKETPPQIDWCSEHLGSVPKFGLQVWEQDFAETEQEVIEYRWYIRQPELLHHLHTKEGYQRYIAFQLLCDLLYHRYQKVELSSVTGKVGVQNTYRVGGLPFSLALHFNTCGSEGKIAFQQVVGTLLQLKTGGVYPQEWDKVKAAFIAENHLSTVSYWHEELSNFWLKNEIIFPNKSEVFNAWVQDLSIQEMNMYVREFLSDMPQDIGIIVPEGQPTKPYVEAQVREWMQSAYLAPIPKYQPPKPIPTLYSEAEKQRLQPSAYRVLTPKIKGTKELILANGIRVILKAYHPPEGVGSNSLKITGWTPRGAGCFSEEDYYSALEAPSLLHHLGLGNFSTKEIEAFKEQNHIVNCLSYIDYYESSLQAEGSVANAEALVQLLSLYFPPFLNEQVGFESWKKSSLQQQRSHTDVYEDFRNAIRQTVGDRTHPPVFNVRYAKGNEAVTSILETHEKRSVQIYKQLFGNPEHWTFLITGNFESEEIIPLLQTYFGTLKENDLASNCIIPDRKEVIGKGPIKRNVTSAVAMDNVMYDLSYYQPQQDTVVWKEALRLKVFGELFKRKLNRLRYEKGFSVYNFGAYGRYHPDEKRYRVQVYIACQPQELASIEKEIQQITEELCVGAFPEAYLKQAKKRIAERYQPAVLKQHRLLHQLLFEHLRYEKPWIALAAYEKFIDEIDKSDMLQIARHYFKENNKVEVTMRDQAHP